MRRKREQPDASVSYAQNRILNITSSSKESEEESDKFESEMSSDLDEYSEDEKTDCESEDERSGNEKMGNEKAANETAAGGKAVNEKAADKKAETDKAEDEGGVEIEVPEIRILDVGGKRPPSVHRQNVNTRRVEVKYYDYR